MNKGLEALNKINSGAVAVHTPYEGWQDENIRIYYAEEFNIIENELKEKEELEKLLAHERELNNHLITHEGKALEVIFKNGLNVPHQDLIKSSKDYNEYKEEFTEILRSHIEPFKYEIMYSEEEFDLLKEVLKV